MIRYYFFWLHSNTSLFCSKTVLIFSFLIIFGTQKVNSQEKNDSLTKWVIGLQGNINQNSVIDNNFSSLPYSGSYLGAAFSIDYQKKKAIHIFEVNYSKGVLKTRYQDKLTQANLNFEYTNLYKFGALESTSLIKFYGGGNFGYLHAARKYSTFINNNETFESAISLGASVKALFVPQGKLSGFSVSNSFSMPIISAVGQPAFGSELSPGSINSEGSKLKSTIESQKILNISEFFQLKNTLAINKYFKRNNKIALSYSINYYHIKTQREVKQSQHSLGLSYNYLF